MHWPVDGPCGGTHWFTTWEHGSFWGGGLTVDSYFTIYSGQCSVVRCGHASICGGVLFFKNGVRFHRERDCVVDYLPVLLLSKLQVVARPPDSCVCIQKPWPSEEHSRLFIAFESTPHLVDSFHVLDSLSRLSRQTTQQKDGPLSRRDI